MEMTGEQIIPAPRAEVWRALNDIDTLKACIPGCDSMTRLADDQIEATVTAKVGPVKATFKGMVTLSDIDPGNGYIIRGEGKGGAAGFARGGARVRLSDAPAGTTLSYTVDATVGGKLAQLGSRLIDSTAKKLAEDFFSRLSLRLGGPSQAAAPPAESSAVTPAAASASIAPVANAPRGRDPLADHQPIRFGTWIAILAALAVLVGLIVVIW